MTPRAKPCASTNSSSSATASSPTVRCTCPSGRAQRADIHLIVGPNRAGKSTAGACHWRLAVRLPHARTPMGFVHPMPELRLGGSLQRTGEGTANAVSLAFERAKGNKNTLRTLKTRAADTALAPWLASLQREAYERMYGLDHDRLVAGGADILAASDDIGRLLFQSAAGIEHLGDALQKLELGSRCPVGAAQGRFTPVLPGTRRLRGRRQRPQTTPVARQDWQAQHEALQTTARAAARGPPAASGVAQQTSRLERIRRVAPLLQTLDAARQQRDQLLAQGNIALLDEDAGQRLAQARQQLALIQADIRKAAGARKDAAHGRAGRHAGQPRPAGARRRHH